MVVYMDPLGKKVQPRFFEAAGLSRSLRVLTSALLGFSQCRGFLNKVLIGLIGLMGSDGLYTGSTRVLSS